MGELTAAQSRGDGQAPLARAGSDSGRKLRIGFVLDVVGYGARTAPLQGRVQQRLPELVRLVLARCGLRLAGDAGGAGHGGGGTVEHEWTGDGINAMLPSDIDPTVVLPVLIRSLAAGLAADNTSADDRVRVRMAVGIGLVTRSGAGFGGPMIVEINRLVSSAKLRGALTDNPAADLAVAVSDQVHSMIIKPEYPGIPCAQFRPAPVKEKEFSGTAWIWVSTLQWSEPAYRSLGPGDPLRAGPYRIAALIGAGPAGRVYLAYSRCGPSPSPEAGAVAVKFFDPGLAARRPAFRRRLEAGLLTAELARGPHLTRVIADDRGAARPWAASPLVRGPSLARAVAETGPLPALSALWLMVSVAHALEALHGDDLIHAGLTPGNVLLGTDGPTVTDTGVNRASLGATWPAPRSGDLHALGRLAVFAATGRDPGGPGEGPGQDLAPAPDLSDCPPELLPFAAECLDPDPERRPSASSLARRLAHAAGTPPRSLLPPAVAARLAECEALPGPPPATRPRRWLRR
ncbi:MAG: hypothetical protein FWE35_20915 [Streptosporangiales bacterium]|nr:hypothetical protein [Streptosporangiales bacterium]